MTAEVLNEDGLSSLGTDSFISDTSIASYKTEKSINSRKSRYNALPRRKYADIGQPSLPPGLVSEDVDEVSVPKVCKIIVQATTTLTSLSRARMIPILNLLVQREGGTCLLVPYLVLRTLKILSSPRPCDRPMGCLRSSHHNLKVLSVPTHPVKRLLHPLKRSRLHLPMVFRRLLPRSNVISKEKHL